MKDAKVRFLKGVFPCFRKHGLFGIFASCFSSIIYKKVKQNL